MLIPELTLRRRFDLGVCHQPDVKLGGFRSRLGASRVSSHTEELWYDETVCLWMIIYISYIIRFGVLRFRFSYEFVLNTSDFFKWTIYYFFISTIKKIVYNKKEIIFVQFKKLDLLNTSSLEDRNRETLSRGFLSSFIFYILYLKYFVISFSIFGYGTPKRLDGLKTPRVK